MKIKIVELEGELNDIRKRIQTINPQDNDITVLGLQPGIGKTTFMKNYCNNNPDYFGIGIATKRHNFLKEAEQDIHGFSHWYGFSKLCAKFEQTKQFHDLGLGASVICPAICSSSEIAQCKYKQQFKQIYRAGFPTEYLRTEYIKPFNLLFVEESLYEYDIYTYDTDKLIQGVQAFIFDKVEDKYLRATIRAIEEHNADFFLKPLFFKTNKKPILMIEMLENQQQTALRNAVKNNDIKTIKQIKLFNAEAVKKCLANNTEYYTEPVLFKVFEIAERKRVVLNHATFDYNIFEKILKRYNRDNPRQFDITVYTSKYKNKKSTIYHYGNKAYSKTSVNLETIYDIVKIFKEKYKNELAVITYKSIATALKKLTDIDAEYFGNTAGLNKFENKKVLLIIGTPNIGHRNKIKLHNSLFGDILDDDYLENEIRYNVTINHEYPNYLDTKLWDIARIDDHELYDTMHRIRPLLSNKEIHVFGKLPGKISGELNVVEITNVEEALKEMNFNKNKTNYNAFIEDALNKEMSNTNFARKYKIRKGDKYDIERVKRIRNEIKDIFLSRL